MRMVLLEGDITEKVQITVAQINRLGDAVRWKREELFLDIVRQLTVAIGDDAEPALVIRIIRRKIDDGFYPFAIVSADGSLEIEHLHIEMCLVHLARDRHHEL